MGQTGWTAHRPTVPYNATGLVHRQLLSALAATTLASPRPAPGDPLEPARLPGVPSFTHLASESRHAVLGNGGPGGDGDIGAVTRRAQGYGEAYLKVDTEGENRENRRVTVRRITPLVKPVQTSGN